ncbi:MAG: MerR family transcriptional regulator [Methylocystis sp.]|uniref:MerR family transcriptional regulator n=1 Tax=Methylocystis sp. TaxID=1911079 RepID=UPI003D0BA38F
MRTIGEVAASLDLPAHVLRFWETRFKQISPLKRAGGRRFYRQRDIELVVAIRQLLYDEGYTIKGVQRILKEQGPEAVIAGAGRRGPEPPTAERPLPVEDGAVDARIGAARDEAVARLRGLSADERDALRAHDPDLDDIDRQSAAPVVEIEERLDQAAASAEARERHEAQARILRDVLAEIEECMRLLKLTKG